MVLGDPVHYTVYGSVSPIVVLQEPPKHFDLVNGVSIDAFRSLSSFQSQFQITDTSSTTTSTTNVTDWSVAAETKGSLTFGLLRSYTLLHPERSPEGKEGRPGQAGGPAELRQRGFGGGRRPGLLHLQDMDVWRHPILNETATDASGNVGPAWYQVVVPIPQDAPINASVCGTNLEWYQPIHENGNLLSYPNSIARTADHPSWATGT